MWNQSISLNHVSHCDQSITTSIHFPNSGLECIFSVVYAKCKKRDRRPIWDQFIQMAQGLHLPWIIGGDLNILSGPSEKAGGGVLDFRAVADFVDFQQLAGLRDTGFEGNLFTWSNNHQGPSRIWARLDRVLTNAAAVTTLPPSRLSISLDNIQTIALCLSKCNNFLLLLGLFFRFMKMWTDHQDFLPFISSIWQQPMSAPPLVKLQLK